MPQIIGQTSIGQTVPVEILRTYTGWALCRPLEPLPNLDAETYLPTGHALLHLSSRRLWVSVFKTTFEQPEVDFEPFIDWMVARGVQPAESWVSIRRLGDTEVPPPKTRSRKGLTPPSLTRALGKGWTPGKIINPETGQREWVGTGEHQGQRRRQIIEPGTRKRKQPVGPIEQQVDATPPEETTPMTQISRRADLDRQMAERLGISRVKAREILSHAMEVLQEQLPDMPRIAQSLVFAWKEARTPAERAPLERAMRNIGLAPIAAAGDTVDFSGSEHISEEPVFAGDPVVVVEPGWRLAPPHAPYLVTKAVVRPAAGQAGPSPAPTYRDQVERAISRGVRKAEAQREEDNDNAPPLIPLDVNEPTYIIRMGMRAAAPDEDTIAKMTQAWQELLPDADLELKAHEVEGLIRQALRLEGESARRRWLNDVVYRLRKQRAEAAPKVTKDGWRQYPTGHTFVSWDVGRIVLASDPNVILYPPLVVNRSQYGSVPVHTGVTIQPGDTDQEAITRALERLQDMPQLKGRTLSELQLQVQPDR